jgi:two-component system KDP operon response regulator KdpE
MAKEQNANQAPSNVKQILLIEDDPLTIETIKLCLEVHRPDIALTFTHEGAQGIDLLRTDGFEALILDLGLPDLDGMLVLEEIRRFSKIPILIVSARSAPDIISRSLELGANDYITKPFDFRLLLARIDRIIQPISPGIMISSLGILDLPGLMIDLGSGKVKLDSREIQLNSEECTLLACLAICEGKIITPDKLSREIWNKDNVDLEQMESIVSALRDKLGDNKPQPKMIISEHGAGYRLLLPSSAVY